MNQENKNIVKPLYIYEFYNSNNEKIFEVTEHRVIYIKIEHFKKGKKEYIIEIEGAKRYVRIICSCYKLKLIE